MSVAQHTSAGQRAQTAGGRTGYLHAQYAASLTEFGVPRWLPHSGGWLLEREVTGTHRDAMGCYPLFACRDWSQLGVDLDALASSLVAVSLVTDPFGGYDDRTLRHAFPDLLVPFKRHYVVDLRSPRVTKHHRYYARKALAVLDVDDATADHAFLDEWMRLHQHLVERHHIRGLKAFSRRSFALQLATPGFSMLRAAYRGEAVAAMMFVHQDDVVHAHVLGCSPAGYSLCALYALIAAAIDRFKGDARWCNLMGVPGGGESGSGGIRAFKRGWAADTRSTFLCGRILQPARYAELARQRGAVSTTYFPAYRDGELL